jgi:hypothetical protein
MLMPPALSVVPKHNPSRECLFTSGRRNVADHVISLVFVLVLSALSVAPGTLPAERSIVWLQWQDYGTLMSREIFVYVSSELSTILRMLAAERDFIQTNVATIDFDVYNVNFDISPVFVRVLSALSTVL